MSENAKKFKKIFKLLTQLSKQQNKLEKTLEKIDWPMELFFISLTNEIILELEKINNENQTPVPKTQKRGSILKINPIINYSKSEKTYLYQLINIFDEIKKEKVILKDETIEYIITPENIQKILQILMAKNKNINTGNNNLSKDINEFNTYIMNLLINIINLSNKILVDVLSSESEYNVFYQLFIFFSKSEENRNLLYELERNIFLYYPENNKLKEIITYTIDCIDEELNKNNCKNIVNEIKKILFLYKHDINIIYKLMMKLIIKIFNLFENEISNNNFISDFLKFCFNEISFDGNNMFYSRYSFSNNTKSKTLKLKNTNLTLENNQERNTEINYNSNNVNDNINRGNTINYINDNKINNIDDKNNNINDNNENENIINDKNEKNDNNRYNADFLNFLFDIYIELINLKLKNSYNIFFIELFLSINNSNEGKKEYLFLIKKTNYIKTILPSLLQLKEDSLIAVYFTKIIFLSISHNKDINDCYMPEIDLNFFIDNIHTFLNDDENFKTFNVISSQIINLIKMNNAIIDIILNKSNLSKSFLSIINSDIYKNEIKKRIIELFENILNLNNNKYNYVLNVPIANYNISDNNLIKKIYSISLIYENNVNEFKNKIILILDYMISLYNKNLIQELMIFIDILFDGICKNILKVPNTKFIDDEAINKLNNLLIDISLLTKNNVNININEIIFILLKFEYNYNKKYIIYNLNEMQTDKKNKLIVDHDIIYKIIKNIFINDHDKTSKFNLLNYIFIYCLDYNEEIDSLFKNGNLTKVDDGKNYLLKAPNILVEIINILYEIKEYQCIEFLIDKIILLMKYSLLNIKLLLINNNFIKIIVKLFIELFPNKKEEQLYIKLNMLLNNFSKYLTETHLIKYLSEIYLIFYNTISQIENNDSNNINKDIILELFNILKSGIIISKNNNYDYMSLSNFCFYNPFIYNLFYIKELNFDEEYNIFLCLNITIRISTYNNIGIFHLVDFINLSYDEVLSFCINNEKKLIITEKSLNKSEAKNKNRKESKFEINNINDILPDDGIFHKVTIIINTKMKKINFYVDQEKIKLYDNINSCKYSSFKFDEFNLLTGYKSGTVKSKLKMSKSLVNIPIIDIRNIFLTKINNSEEYHLINNRKRSIYINDIFLENIYKDKKYFDEINNKSVHKFIILDINFKNKNIIIKKSKKIKQEIKSLNDYLSNDIFQDKYIPCYSIYFPSNINTINNSNFKVYMLSLVNNLEEYYSLNNSNNIILYNINKKYLESKLFENFNTAFSSCNYFFIDFLICFFFDIEKRRNKIMNKNRNDNTDNEEQKLDNENENKIINTSIDKPNVILNDNFIKDCILIIFEIIISLPNKEIIDYFLYQNNIISIKLKIFFLRNIYLFNDDNEFIQKLFQILSVIQKNSILEEDKNNNLEFILIFISEIFLDLLFFQKLNFNTQNIILIELIQLLNYITFPDKEYMNNILYKILKDLYKIILYYELSNEQINYNLDEENNNPTQIDFILKCINSLLHIFESNKNKIYINKIIKLNLDINNVYSKFNENIEIHNIKNFNEENKSYIQNTILNYDLIYKQLEKVINFVSKSSIQKLENNENYNNNNDDVIELSKSININDNKICWFCIYLNIYFKIKFNNLYDHIKFDKIIDNNYISIFLNFNSYRKILGINNFGWFLSRNESNHKIQNKFFLKKNDIRQKKGTKIKINGEAFTYEYIYDKQKYELSIKLLYELFLYDNICKDSHLINNISEINNSSNDNIENCLYIQTIHKTLSVLILLKDCILIFTNLCIDNNKQLHVVKNEIDSMVWCLRKDDYEKELDQFISKNDQNIIKELFTNKGNNKKNKIKGFGYNNSYNFSFKKIYYRNIAEMHRVSYLTIPNSIEIFMKNGKSYFICLNISKREKIFTDIICKMSEFYSHKEKLEGYYEVIQKKTSKNLSVTDNFYMKHCPITYLDNNSKECTNSSLFGAKLITRRKANTVANSGNNIYNNKTGIKIKHTKALITVNTFLSEVCEFWTKNKISNFDYIMLLNILSGRSLNNLSQYFIFPRLLNDFNHTILNWISSSIYRDLSYSILGSEPLNREEVKNKYNTTEVDRYHSGTFYSTYAFVAYFLIRQRPFSEISLEIQGGEFDATDRLFIGAKEICSMREKYQESIPSLMTLPEIYINSNKFNFGKRQKSKLVVNDFELPNWCKDDPRKFSLVIKRIFETKNVNIKLNKWIDLIFGIGQSGPDAIKYLNTYRKACYELPLEDIEDLYKNYELTGILLEKQEMGYVAKQIFKKAHKKKENLNEYRENENMFYNTNLKLRKIKLMKINNIEYNNEKNSIIFNSINDFLVDIDNDYIKDTNIKNNFQGGIASLKSIMKAFDDNYNYNQKYNNPSKVINILEKANKFIILGDKYHFLGKNYNYILSYNDKYLEIINYKLDLYFCYYLNESNNISTLITNDKGNKIYIAFNNGNIFEYKIIFQDESSLKENKDINNNLYPFIKSNTVDKLSIKFKEIYIYNLKEDNVDKSFVSIKRSESKKPKKKIKIIKASPPIISLQKNFENNFSLNNPHIPEKIIKLKLNEANQILIALTISNIIYLISLNNKFKLMHIINYYNNYKFQYKIKDIIPFSNNGDFLIYSSMTVHLFSINGVPLCELNLLDKVYESLTKITCCSATFLYDVILFTGHEDGSIIIWKVKNKNMLQNFNERVSYVYNNNNSKCFLNEYYYNYDFDLDDKNYNYDIKECELQRKFEIVSQIKMEEKIDNLSLNFMKMSPDMSYMFIIDNKKDIYILSNFDDYKEENNSNNNLNPSQSNSNIFGYFKEKKIHCVSCCKEIEDNYYRASRVQSLNEVKDDSTNTTTCEESLYSPKHEDDNNISINYNLNEKEINKKDNKDNKDNNYICEECKLKLINTEYYLYNY